ncbi:alpha-amylase [Edaphovirga cremea]|uniref:alpha-amylase n=1 Tax=Edaphovirga cremea TaxID=2267246 RepID=UPI0039897347
MKNPTILQFFHWYYPEGGKLWPEATERAQHLADIGVTAVWLPPACKGASGGYSVGYDTYDLFDLGEFDQKGTRATKYGDKEALLQAVSTLREKGVKVLMDVVFNHKIGADEKERVSVRPVDPDNRNNISCEVIEGLAYTRFTFDAREGKYSKFIWDFKCFSGVDYLEDPDMHGVFKIVNDYGDDGWNDEVDDELGNFDYLMGANIEIRNLAVQEELKYWGRWLLENVPCDGFRLDAVKHIPAWFFKDWLEHVREEAAQDLLVIAEYWSPDLEKLQQYIDRVEGKLMLFDVPLHFNFHTASNQGAEYDLTKIFAGTLTAVDPLHSVTIVANHDTQPLQALEAPVEHWFKPLAYALILLREQGVPCVFYPDLFGASYEDEGGDGGMYQIDMPIVAGLETLIKARERFAHGAQTDYFDDANCIAFVRAGIEGAPGCVVVLSNGAENAKTVALGEGFEHKKFRDYLGNREDIPQADEHGNVTLPVKEGSVSVWVLEDVL